jgi:hypothetical protein
MHKLFVVVDDETKDIEEWEPPHVDICNMELQSFVSSLYHHDIKLPRFRCLHSIVSFLAMPSFMQSS